jgi:hypothetical protein
LMEAALGIPHAQGLINRCQHRLDPLQPVGDRTCRQVQIVLFELPQEPLRGPIRRILVQQDLYPNRNAVIALGDQFGGWWGRQRSPRGIAVAGRPIAMPSNLPPMGPHIDLQHFRVLRSRHHRRRLSAMWADQRFFRQRDELLLDRQMGIVAPTMSRMARLRTSFLYGRRNFVGIG